MSLLKKESKGSFSNHSPAFTYFVPSIDKKIKVERVYHRTYVAHFSDGPERVTLGDIKAEKWECVGKWEDEDEK